MRRTVFAGLLAFTASAGAAFALLAFASPAFAWDWMNLPNGYSVADSNLGNGCHGITVNGNLIGSTCDPGFQTALNAFVDSTVCVVNPAVGGSACQPKTTTTAPVVQTTTTAPVLPPADPVTTTVVVTTPAYTDTVTVTVPAAATDLTGRVDLIEQRLLAVEGRTQALEDQIGLIIGEPKNVAPFTNPV